MEAKNPATARTPAGQNDNTATPGTAGALASGQVGVALGAWQSTELRLARRYGECRGLTPEQLEDLYQDTALALLRRSFQTMSTCATRCAGASSTGRYTSTATASAPADPHEHAPQLTDPATLASRTSRPEDAAVLDGDRVIVSEFLAELDALERRIFWLTAEGLRYRSIAPILGVDVNEARKAARSCEQKRQRFQILYDSGRLCGYRAQTITAIKTGQQVTAELASAPTPTCTAVPPAAPAQHQRQAAQSGLQAHAAALAPLPLLSRRLPWLTRLELRTRSLAARTVPHAMQTPGGGVLRERAITLLATGGAAGKLAAGAATIAVIAGGTLGATNALQPQRKTGRSTTSSRTARDRSGAHTANPPRRDSHRRSPAADGGQRHPGSHAAASHEHRLQHQQSKRIRLPRHPQPCEPSAAGADRRTNRHRRQRRPADRRRRSRPTTAAPAPAIRQRRRPARRRAIHPMSIQRSVAAKHSRRSVTT